jgi:hypothetical protein
MRYTAVGFAVFGLFAFGTAQQAQVPHKALDNHIAPDQPQQIKLERTIVIPMELSGLLQYPDRCDNEGNIYFRRVDVDRGEHDLIKKVNLAGEVKATFDVQQAGKDFVAQDYFVSGDGDVSIVGFRQGERDILGSFVATYGRDGTFKLAVKLDAPRIVPSTIGVFDDGSFLITALKIPGPKGKNSEDIPTLHEPFTAIFKEDGSLIKELTFEEDGRIADAIQNRDQAFVGDQGHQIPFTGGTILHGRDENLYITRKTSPLIMYAISPAGNVQRTVKVTPPEPGMMPNAVVANSGTVAVLFASGISGPRQLVLADRQTGEIRNTYAVQDKLGVALACYAPENFVFLGTEKGKMSIQIAKVQ